MKINKMIVIVLLTGFVSLWGAISGSKHDLDSIVWSGTATEDNDELCVYCHTPHAANTGMVGAPIWNKATGSTAANAFTLYGTTIAATTAGNAGSVNPPSMACLSCHDGVSAVNSIVNAPGSGLVGAIGADGVVGDTATNITNALLSTSTATNIGADLSNDHPISIVYTAGKAGLRATTYDISAWAGATTIADILRTTGGSEYVECGSCHDPHDGASTSSATSVAFLRIANTNSQLCLGCHDK